MNREAVESALFTLLQGAFAWVDSSRQPRMWTNVEPALQPAMYLQMGRDTQGQTVLGLTKYDVTYHCLIYFRADQVPSSSLPATFANSLIAAVDAALQSVPPGEKQSLGGACYHARIEGEVLKDLGVLDQQCVIAIPILVISGI